jgi:phosphinothricin acetyltransferase
MIVRLAIADDFDAITAIYNHYVAVSTTTYDDEPVTAEDRRKAFAARESIHPVMVAVRNGELIGFGALSPFRERRGYRFTVENSVYVRADCHRQGVGSAILADQIQRARTLKLHAIVAVIDSEQSASIALHAKHGFTQLGRLPQVGFKFDRWLDIVFMERILEESGQRAVGGGQ